MNATLLTEQQIEELARPAWNSLLADASKGIGKGEVDPAIVNDAGFDFGFPIGEMTFKDFCGEFKLDVELAFEKQQDENQKAQSAVLS